MVPAAVETALVVLLLLFAANFAFGLRMLDAIVGARLHQLRLLLVDVRYRVRNRDWRRQEDEREHYLWGLLKDSSEPIVVTDDEHRLLAANPPALTLFGISETNLNNFSIDAFLRPDQVRCFEREGPPFKRVERLGECQIRPLNGKPKVVAFSFQENFLLGRHLSKFHDAAPTR